MFYSNQKTMLKGMGLIMLALSMLISSCSKDNNNDFDDHIVDFTIVPDKANIEVGDTLDFSVVAVTAAGEEIKVPASFTTEWISTDATVFSVNKKGIATGQEAGTAYCVFEASGDNDIGIIDIRRPFVGRDSAFVSIFR